MCCSASDAARCSWVRWLLMPSSGLCGTVWLAPQLLELRGKDLRALPLLKRKAQLERLLRKSTRIRYLTHVGEDGERLRPRPSSRGSLQTVPTHPTGVYFAISASRRPGCPRSGCG